MKRLEELLHRWRDGSLSEQELLEFRELLQDETQRNLVYDEIRLSGAIAEALKAVSEAEALPRNGAPVTLRRNAFRVRRLRRLAPRRTGIRIAGFLAACLLIVVGLMRYRPDVIRGLLERDTPSRPPVAGTGSAPPAEPAGPVIARLTAGGAGARVFRKGTHAPLEAVTELRVGDTVHAACADPVSVAYADGRVRVSASPNAEFTIATTELFVDRGRIEVTVTPRRGDPAVAVVTPHARAQVVGTRFSVDVEGDATCLRVAEGSVRFSSAADGSSLLVEAGGSAVARAGAGVAPDPPPVIVVDNTDPDTSKTGEWILSQGKNPWGENSWYSDKGSSTFTWTPRIAVAGTYRVYARWTYHANRSSKVGYRITHAAGAAAVFVNQHDESLACAWHLLGTYPFAAGTAGTIVVSAGNGQANADAVKLEWAAGPSGASPGAEEASSTGEEP